MEMMKMHDIFEMECNHIDSFVNIPTGTFAVESWTGIHGTEIVELCEIPLEWLHPTELPNLSVVAQYAELMQAGKHFPPIHVMQTAKGTLRINNGHHRFEAVKLAGKTTIRAWVSWLMWTECHHPTGLTREAMGI